MTPLSEMIPGMTDADLKSLRANAERLTGSGSAVQAATAADLLPLIDAETARRDALPKPVAVKKARTVKAKVAPVTGHQTALA